MGRSTATEAVVGFFDFDPGFCVRSERKLPAPLQVMGIVSSIMVNGKNGLRPVDCDCGI
jgi:hypothetical protein